MTKFWRRLTLCRRNTPPVARCLLRRWHRGSCDGFLEWVDVNSPIDREMLDRIDRIASQLGNSSERPGLVLR